MIPSELTTLLFPPVILQKMEEQCKDVVRFDDANEARTFVRDIWPQIEQSKLEVRQPEAYELLKKLYYRNKFVLIPKLPNKEILELCEKGLGEYFTEMMEDQDLWDKIKAKLLALYYDQRDVLKEDIRNALLRNNDRITEKPIIRNAREFDPTIRQWLLDYTSVVGTGKIDSVALNEYLSTSPNCQKLSPAEKLRVRGLITLYERLKRSTGEPDGLEEALEVTIGDNSVILREGRIEEYDPKIIGILKKFKQAGVIDEIPDTILNSKAAALSGALAVPTSVPLASTPAQPLQPLTDLEKKVLAAYQGDAKFQQTVARLTDELRQKALLPTAVRNEFYRTVQTKRAEETVAVLRLMAERGEVESFLKEDKKLSDFLAGLWEKQGGKQLADAFRSNPAQPKFVRMFLHYILVDRLGMKSSDAAREAVKLGNIFVKAGHSGYNKMAFFDERELAFKWFED